MNKKIADIDLKNIIVGVIVALIGLIVLIFPKTSINIVVVLLGVISVATGIYNLVKYNKLTDDPSFKKVLLTKCLTSILIGLLGILVPIIFVKTIEVAIKVILFVMAIYFLFSAASQILLIHKLKAEGNVPNNFGVEVVGNLVIAVLLFLLAGQHIGLIVIRIVGVALILAGICYSVYYYFNKTLVIEAENVRDIDDSESEEKEE